MTGLVVMQGVHVAAGVVFAGGHLVMSLAVWPAVLGLPAGDARRVLARLAPRLRAVMAPAALLTLGLGIARGTWFGPIGSPGDLVDTAYGRWWALALAGTLALWVWGIWSGGWLARGLFAGEGWSPDARRRVASVGAVSVGLVAAVIGLMAAMRLGVS